MKIFSSLFSQFFQIGDFWQKKYNRNLVTYTLILIFVQIIVLIFSYDDLPPQIPLFYSLPWGQNQLANTSYIFILPISSTVILIINTTLISFLAKIRFLSISLLVSPLIYSLLTLVSCLNIISLFV